VPCRFSVLVTRAHILEEIELRRRFFASRLEGPPDAGDDKDRVDVAHGAVAEILICDDCGILMRHEDASPDFKSDPYAPFAMERMLRAHIDAYRRKASVYRPLLPEKATVVEAGSYIGGFLHVAAEWGWNAIGVDVGGDTANFARSHSYPTKDGTLEAAGFADASFDAVFNWNCFEQLADPDVFLAEARRILKPRGTLVIRTPNAAYYIACERRRDPDILLALGHANLLGFPHLYGYDAMSLHRVVARHGFVQTHQIGDRHIMPSLRPLSAAAMAEARRVEALVPLPPWFEAVFSVV
jgi:SAM-dependent methyltransferase